MCIYNLFNILLSDYLNIIKLLALQDELLFQPLDKKK